MMKRASLLIDRPSPSLDRIYQLGLWSAIFFAIFLRLPPDKFLRFRRTFHQFRSGWLCYFCYYAHSLHADRKGPNFSRVSELISTLLAFLRQRDHALGQRDRL